MSVKRFSSGQQFQWQGRVFEVKRLLPEAMVNIEDIFTGAVRVVAMNELVAALFAGELRFVTGTRTGKKPNASDSPLPEEMQVDLSDYPESRVAAARFRLEVIKPLVALSPAERTPEAVERRIREVRESLPADDERRGLSRRSVFRWMRDYAQAGCDLRALIPNTARCGGLGKSRLPPEAGNLIDSVIRDYCYRRERFTVFDVQCEVAARIEEENRLRPAGEGLKYPSKGAISRRIEALDLRERFAARHGKRAAKREFSQVGRMDYPDLPGERVEMDHTQVGLIVVDEVDNLPLGRPTLTYCLDVPTRYPMGYYIGFEPPSYYTVMECLYHAICPKEGLRERYGLEHDWLACGIPSALIVDNGKEFVGRDLSDACELLGAILEYAPVRTPEFKAPVERVFGTLRSGLFDTVPGATFANIFEKGDYDSAQMACVSLGEIEQALAIFVVDIYAERRHSGLRGIPARRWEDAIREGFLPRLPRDKEELLILLGRVDHRALHRSGIEFHRLRYNCPELAALRHRLKGEPAKIKYHPGDLSRLHVFDPFDKRYIEVPSLDEEYTRGLSLWKHEVILNFARRQDDDDDVDLAALGRARRRIQEIVEAARSRKRVSGRSRIARWERGGQPPSLAGKAQANAGDTPPATETPTLPLPDGSALVLDVAPGDGWGITYDLPRSGNRPTLTPETMNNDNTNNDH